MNTEVFSLGPSTASFLGEADKSIEVGAEEAFLRRVQDSFERTQKQLENKIGTGSLMLRELENVIVVKALTASRGWLAWRRFFKQFM